MLNHKKYLISLDKEINVGYRNDERKMKLFYLIYILANK